MALVLALSYVGLHFYSRWARPPLRRNEPPPIRRVDDFYVHPPKSYVTDIATAQKLVGRPLWVIAGYRWRTGPDGRLLAPLEKIVPTAIEPQGDQGVIRFEHEGPQPSRSPWARPIGSTSTTCSSSKTPGNSTATGPTEIWAKVEKHQIEIGMTEFQVTFALGRETRSVPRSAGRAALSNTRCARRRVCSR